MWTVIWYGLEFAIIDVALEVEVEVEVALVEVEVEEDFVEREVFVCGIWRWRAFCAVGTFRRAWIWWWMRTCCEGCWNWCDSTFDAVLACPPHLMCCT